MTLPAGFKLPLTGCLCTARSQSASLSINKSQQKPVAVSQPEGRLGHAQFLTSLVSDGDEEGYAGWKGVVPCYAIPDLGICGIGSAPAPEVKHCQFCT